MAGDAEQPMAEINFDELGEAVLGNTEVPLPCSWT
jgi:hypothetical protein